MTDETCCGACGYPIHATKESACDWCRQSADRIEALTVERDAWKGQHAAEALGLHVQMQRAEAAEAKLAKAVEALEVIRDRQYYRMGPGITAQVIARATLAEIEGEKR